MFSSLCISSFEWQDNSLSLSTQQAPPPLLVPPLSSVTPQSYILSMIFWCPFVSQLPIQQA